jgi:hypothetical protein
MTKIVETTELSEEALDQIQAGLETLAPRSVFQGPGSDGAQISRPPGLKEYVEFFTTKDM